MPRGHRGAALRLAGAWGPWLGVGVLRVRKWQEWDQAAKKCPIREKGEPTAPSEGPQVPGACVLAARGRRPSWLGLFFFLETSGFRVSSLCLVRKLEVQHYHPGQRAVLPPLHMSPSLSPLVPAGVLPCCTRPAASWGKHQQTKPFCASGEP